MRKSFDRLGANRTCWARWLCVVLFVCVHLWLMTPHALARDMRFQRVMGGNDSHGPHIGVGTIDAISQDRLGFMWFGGENALLRFDGAEFRRYDPSGKPGDLPSNAIRAIVVDQSHEMWLGTDVGLVQYSDHTDQFTVFRGLGHQAESLPSAIVTALAVDKKNNLIIGTANGVTVLDRNRKIFIPLPLGENAEPNKRHVYSLFVDSKNRLWVGTQSAGLFLFSVERELIRHYAADLNDPSALRSNSISSIAEDRLGRVWVGTFGGGASRMNEGERTLTNFFHQIDDPKSLQSNIVTEVYLDSDDKMWIATEQGGLAQYNPESNDFIHYVNSPYDSNSLPTDQVRTIAEDREGNLWVTTFPGGVSFYDRSHANVENFVHKTDDPHSLTHSSVLSFLKVQRGQLWAGTEDGLNVFDLDKGKIIAKYVAGEQDALNLSANAVLALEQDADGHIWIGTWAGGLQRYDPSTADVFDYKSHPNQQGSLPDNFVWSLLVDSSNVLWVGMETGGLAKFDRKTETFTVYQTDLNDPDSISSNFVQAMLEDSRGHFWVATTGGLDRFDREREVFEHFRLYDDSNGGTIRSRITALMEDSSGYVWVGTQGDGIFVYDPDKNTFNTVFVPDKEVTRIASFIEDNQKYVWAGTTAGLYRVDPSSLTLQIYGRQHGLVGNSFNRGAVFKDAKGFLYFGGTDGFSVFDPRLLIRPSDDYSLVLTDLKIHNQSVKVGTEGSPLKKSISYTDQVVLQHDQKMVSFTFSALDFRSMGDNKYAYMLDGFDYDWLFVDELNQATYTNLDPGEYHFRVKGADRDENWGQRIAEVKVIVLPSPWVSWWAFLIYLFLLALFVRWMYETIKTQLEAKNRKILAEEVAQINEAKDTFIKNTSYEFYQPVRDIVRISESILTENKDSLAYGVSQKIKSIINRGNNLASIIYEIQDLGQLNDNAVEPHFSAVDLQTLVAEVFEEHETLGQQKNIRLVNAVDQITPKIWADRTYLAQALSILVANAMHDLMDGVVTIRAIVLVQKVQIEIEDTGSGIAQETYQALFGVGNQTAVKSGAGVITQLSQVKHLVELQGSALTCRSRWAEADSKNSFGLGAGTCFGFIMSWAEEFEPQASADQAAQPTSADQTPVIEADSALVPLNEADASRELPIEAETEKPVAQSALEEADEYANSAEAAAPDEQTDVIPEPPAESTIEPTAEDEQNSEAATQHEPETQPEPEMTDEPHMGPTNMQEDDSTPSSPRPAASQSVAVADTKTVLIVDDDPINRMVLSGMLGQLDCTLLEVSSGPEALELILEKQTPVNMILLDVMMPRMTGFEVCEHLRKHFDQQELPIIFLTAKHEEQDIIKGKESGGNEVLHKPVKKNILMERVNFYLGDATEDDSPSSQAG